MASFAKPDEPRAPLRPLYVPARGTHIWVNRPPITHHGIDYGDGTVADFSGTEGQKAMVAGRIQRVTLDQFSGGEQIYVQRYGRCDSPDKVIERAESMIGKSGYDPFSNNCEHFAIWCMTGYRDSTQVHALRAVTASYAAHKAAPRVAARVIASSGSPASSGAAKTMSGLREIGGTVGGGVTLLTLAGALVGAASISYALRERDYETDEERHAKRVGRQVGIGGAVVTAGGIYFAIGALGTPGYSAAGLSSGLAQLGGTTGGMASGLAFTITAPMLAAMVLAALALLYMRAKTRNRPEPPAALACS